MPQYVYPGPERVFHDVVAAEVLPGVLDRYGYRRAFIVCSKTLNRTTDAVGRIERGLGERCVGLTDEVSQHAPIGEVLGVSQQLRDAEADVIVSVGGGSVIDLCKFAQLCITENITTRDELQPFTMTATPVYGDTMPPSRTPPALRQFAVPTTLATAEVTPGGTPVDELTRRKINLRVQDGAPEVLIYDPDILLHTPRDLLIATGVRGLDHAINTLCSSEPEPLSTLLAGKAAQLFFENLPCIAGPESTAAARSNCQRASFYTGLGQMSAPHGFSHFMVHVLAPLVDAPHSATACVCMLAQARWFEGCADEQHAIVLDLLGRRGERFHELLYAFLLELGMPTTVAELGVTDADLERAIELGLQHDRLTKNNLRPIESADDLREVMAFVS